MDVIRLGEKGWTGAAHRLLLNGIDFSLIVRGWRARRLRNQLPRLANASRATREKRRLSYDQGNFSILDMWLLFGFHRVFFFALGQNRFVSWSDTASELSVCFSAERPKVDRVISRPIDQPS